MLSMQARIAILEVHARDKKMAPDADFHKIARATGGFSGAQLMNLMNVAAINAVQRGAPAVNTDDMFTVRLPSTCTCQKSIVAQPGQSTFRLTRRIAACDVRSALNPGITNFLADKIIKSYGFQIDELSLACRPSKRLKMRILEMPCSMSTIPRRQQSVGKWPSMKQRAHSLGPSHPTMMRSPR